MHWVCIEILYNLVNFGIFPTLIEFLVNKNVFNAFPFSFAISNTFSEGNFEDQECLNNPTDQGKPSYPLDVVLHSIAHILMH